MRKSNIVSQIFDQIPDNRIKSIKLLRKLIKKNMPKEIKETINENQFIYTLPLKFCPDNYTKRPLLYATLTNRKSYISLNLICIHNDKKYRDTFALKILKTGACSGATGCCYKIKFVNKELESLLEKEVSRLNLEKFISTFKKYRLKK